MALVQTKGAYALTERRHPRLVRAVAALRRHRVLVGCLCAAAVGGICVLDLETAGYSVVGLYILPLGVMAVALRERAVALGVVATLALMVAVMVVQDDITLNSGFVLASGVLFGVACVGLSYLIQRMSTISDHATLRAHLAEVGADILGEAPGADLDELLQYALERVGEQLDAAAGVLLLLEDGRWVGRAGYGLGVDARDLVAAYDDAPLAAQVMRGEGAVSRDLGGPDIAPLTPVDEHLKLERALLVPMHALERDVGLIVYNRAQVSGDYNRDQITLADWVARYLAVAVDNVRLMVELSTRRRDLELVRDSSLDFAQSIDLQEVLEAVVTRLLDALDTHAVDVYEVDIDNATMRLLVSWDDGAFDEGEWAGREFPIDYFASSALAIRSRRPVVIASCADERLNDVERELMDRWGHEAGLTIPLRIREHVIALVEVMDDRKGRDFSDDEVDLARTICRFAALAIDKARLFDQQRATVARRDRLARRLQRLQSFAVDLNGRLDRAELNEVEEEVVRAALDLLHVRVAAVVAGAGEYLAVRALALEGEDAPAPAALLDAEADLLESLHKAQEYPMDEHLAGGELMDAAIEQSGRLLLAALEGETPQQASSLVVADKRDGDFDTEDRLLLATLAAQLSASLHNAAAYQREHKIAETFQQALLMPPPAIPGIDIGVHYRAATESARVGGDFYDLVTLGPGRLMVIVGDVCGKSLAAAAQSAVVRYMLRAYAAEGSPGEALARLNSAVITQTPNQPFITLVVAYLDVARHMFEYAVAGHPRPLVLAGHGEFPVPGEGNVPVGIFRGAVYPTNRAVLPDDSCIVFYTDGITDARRDGVLFGEERLREAVRANLPLPAQDLADVTLATVKEYAGDVLADDCAVVTVKLP